MNIAVVFGGRSNEHEISVITALEVCKALDTNKHKLIPVYIDIKGRWFTGEELLKKDFYKNLPQSLEMVEEVALLPKPGTPGLKLVGEKGFSLFSSKKEFIEVDVFFPAFHGQFGEDGCIQGLFEMADVAYTGCNVLTSALAMDKFACKAMLQEQGIPVLPSTVVLKKDFQKNIQAVKANILKTKGLESFPLFVKPLSLGSSIGVSKAGDEAALDVALAKVFQYDTEAIVEPCVVNKLEINVSVRSTDTIVSSVTEVPVASDGTLTYEDKYLRGGKGKKGPAASLGMASLIRKIDPDDLSDSIKAQVKQNAEKAYKALGCLGVVRFDFMMNLDSGIVYFNELNPFPGSMAHYLWEKSKPAVLYPELLNQMIEEAVERKRIKSSLTCDMGFKAMFK